MKETLKDIEQLTSGLYRSREAAKVAAELFEADTMASGFKTVTPDARLIAAIKANVASELSEKRGSNKWIVRAIAMAACVMFAYTLTTRLYLNKEPLPAQKTSQPAVADAAAGGVEIAMVWDDDADQVSVLSTTLSNIETAFYQTEDNAFEAEFCITDIETQVSDLQGLFWKG